MYIHCALTTVLIQVLKRIDRSTMYFNAHRAADSDYDVMPFGARLLRESGGNHWGFGIGGGEF
mgnify:CR=1 FL=1